MEPGGNLSGVVPIDLAKLEAGVAVYVGQHVDWDAAYVELEGKSVVVVTVEPPRWGDPIRCFRKAYLPAEKVKESMPAATIFVRIPPVPSAQLRTTSTCSAGGLHGSPARNLTSTFGRSRAPNLDVSTAGVGTIEAFAATEEQRLLSRLTRSQAGGAVSNALFSVVEHRSGVDFRQEVTRYVEQVKQRLRGVLMANAVLHNVGLLELEILNRTDVTFIAVQVALRLPAPVGVCVWRRDATDLSTPAVMFPPAARLVNRNSSQKQDFWPPSRTTRAPYVA